MPTKVSSKIPYIFLAGWFFINLLQSYFTELAHDEAYYWFYAQELDWGYFDHPPAVAWWGSIGYTLINNEVGLRLLTLFSGVGVLFILWKMVKPKDTTFFFLLLFAIGLVQVHSFILTPDVPLLFFTGLFFLLYKKYLEEDNLLRALLLVFVLAGMAYSKYHGALVVLFAFLPNWRLLKRPSSWAIILGTSLLLLPHLYWQFEHDFPTFRFQLSDRSTEPYSFIFPLEYLGGQLLVFGPLVSLLLFSAAWKFQASSPFGRSLKWCFWGILVFFLLSSFKGRAEANWTTAALIPLVLMVYPILENNLKWRKLGMLLAQISLLLFLAGRIFLMYDFLPEGMNPRSEFHGWKKWATQIKQAAGSLPVVFFNDYQRSAKYGFYSGRTSFSWSQNTYSGSQWDYSQALEDSLQGKTVFMLNNSLKTSQFVETEKEGKEKYLIVDDFYTFLPLHIEILEEIGTYAPNEQVELTFRLINRGERELFFHKNPKWKVNLACNIFHYKKYVRHVVNDFPLPLSLKTNEEFVQKMTIRMPEEVGKYRIRPALQVGSSDEKKGYFQELWVK